jgi:SAM-dependent methyltransferase
MADRYFTDSYLAAVYDACNPRSRRVDYDFYLPRIMAAAAVLDAGCGTGTLLSDARDRGHVGRLVGLDPGEGMLARARRRDDIEWILGDLATARWDCAFDLVVMTGHAFQAIVTDEALAASLDTVHRALTPGGVFAFETRNPAARAWESWRPENARNGRDPDGLPVLITTEVIEPFDGRSVTFTHTFTGEHPSLPQVSCSTLRFLASDELAGLLTQTGFRIEALFGDFGGQPLAPESPEIITIARAAG